MKVGNNLMLSFPDVASEKPCGEWHWHVVVVRRGELLCDLSRTFLSDDLISCCCILDSQDEQPSVSEGVTSEGTASLVSSTGKTKQPYTSCLLLCWRHSPLCVSQTLTSSCKIGPRWRPTTAGLPATRRPPHPGRRHHRNLPGNSNSHTTNSFHSEWDRPKCVDISDDSLSFCSLCHVRFPQEDAV